MQYSICIRAPKETAMQQLAGVVVLRLASIVRFRAQPIRKEAHTLHGHQRAQSYAETDRISDIYGIGGNMRARVHL